MSGYLIHIIRSNKVPVLESGHGASGAFQMNVAAPRYGCFNHNPAMRFFVLTQKMKTSRVIHSFAQPANKHGDFVVKNYRPVEKFSDFLNPIQITNLFKLNR